MNNCQYFTPFYNESNICVTDRELNINCAGVSTLPAGKSSEEKILRKDYYLAYLTNGELNFTYNNKALSLKSGCFAIIKPGSRYHYAVTDECTYYWIHFTGNSAKRLLENLHMPLETVIDISVEDNILRAFHRIFEEFIHMDSFFEISSTASLISLLTRFARAIVEHTAKNCNLHDLSGAFTYLNRHYNENVSIKKLASHVNISYGHFRRLFKETTNMTPVEYLTKLRLEKACVLLNRLDISIKDAAAKVGFPDQAYFTRVFTKHYGISPSKYRSIHKHLE